MRAYSGLITDLYELAMAAGYIQTSLRATATFELFVRHLPARRSYLVAAGLQQAVAYLQNVRFTSSEIDYLRSHPAFKHVHREFFDYLGSFRFAGDVWAVPEGTLVFPGEPLVRVTAALPEAQIVETALLATCHFQTLIASKAARVVSAAQGRPVVEFGSRRAHGIEAGVLAARAAYLAGCEGTSNVFAGWRFGIPTYGTQAHSWIMSHRNEREAFAQFLDVFPEQATLLVDTYNVHRAVNQILAMGRKPAGIRLDSGDLVRDSLWTRRRLDRAGWRDVQLFASGDLYEEKIAKLLARGARIDGFGVGTALATSSDAPALSVIYKLVEVVRDGRSLEAAKFSHAKATYPGRKQVFRFQGRSGKFRGDVIALENERLAGGEPLLVPVLRGGKCVAPIPGLAKARQRCLQQLQQLPERFRALHSKAAYPVRLSARLEKLYERLRRTHRLR